MEVLSTRCSTSYSSSTSNFRSMRFKRALRFLFGGVLRFFHTLTALGWSLLSKLRLRYNVTRQINMSDDECEFDSTWEDEDENKTHRKKVCLNYKDFFFSLVWTMKHVFTEMCLGTLGRLYLIMLFPLYISMNVKRFYKQLSHFGISLCVYRSFTSTEGVAGTCLLQGTCKPFDIVVG